MGDMLTQEEINALLGGGSESAGEAAPDPEEAPSRDLGLLSGYQKDILGEIGNISMGTSATTLFALLGQRVNITTPRVSVVNWSDLSDGYDRPCVGIRVDYKEGIEGSNVLILKEQDVKVITNLMLGGDGTQDIDEPINDIDLSAIGEAMNQMVGSASTSLSSLIKMRIDIDTPHAFQLDLNNEHEFMESSAFGQGAICCTKFRMQIGDLIDSEIMQLVPLAFAFTMIEVMEGQLGGGQPEAPSVARETPAATRQEPVASSPVKQEAQPQQPVYQAAPEQQPVQPVYAQEQMPQHIPQQVYVQPPQQQQYMNAQPVQFSPFDAQELIQQKENIGIIMDVPLEITVELGRTSKKIKEILEFTPGTIVELDKLAGEPIDVMVNGKFVARGEVVVIDENYGIRIMDIVNVESRI